MPDRTAVPIEHSNEHQTPTLKRPTRGRFRTFIVLALTILGIYICYLLVLPFLPALAWALVLSLLFLPAHKWIKSRVRSPNLAATVSVMLLGLMVVVPGLVLGSQLVQEAARGAVSINAKLSSGDWLRSLEANPITAAVARWVDLPLDEHLGMIDREPGFTIRKLKGYTDAGEQMAFQNLLLVLGAAALEEFGEGFLQRLVHAVWDERDVVDEERAEELLANALGPGGRAWLRSRPEF